jgi:hypothetical protein
MALALEGSGKVDRAIAEIHLAADLAESVLAADPKDFSCQLNAATENRELGRLLLHSGNRQSHSNT